MLRIPLVAPLTALLLALPAIAHAADPLIVHEWGTFTSLQDEQGQSLGRINTDDEPVPDFVHTLPGPALYPPTAAYTSYAKGIPAGDPNVTVRLETPVLYFHLPKNHTAPLTVSVNVAFRGGWLTQYFPDAQASIQGATTTNPLPPLTASSLGHLSWPNLILNSNHGAQPETTDPVWTAPRAVDSTTITSQNEREQFLFYRGVGHLDAPLLVTRKQNTLHLQLPPDAPPIQKLWLVDIAPDGNLAFRTLPNLQPHSEISAEFTPADHRPENRAQLRKDLHHALVADGLFNDEADALLNTWQNSYFHNPGQRLFFLVPQSWTDTVLPLTISSPLPTKITRTMVARIELVTPAQRTLLQHMAQQLTPDPKTLHEVTAAMSALQKDPTRRAAYTALAAGHGNLQDLGVPTPSIYLDYLALGRFRTPLLFQSNDPTLERLAPLLTP